MSKSQKTLVRLRQDVYQANPLMESCKNFSLLEHRVFYLGLRGVNPHLSNNDKFYDTDFSEIFIPNDQLKTMFGNKWYLSELKPLCEKLFDSKIRFKCDKGGWEIMHIFRRLKYVPSEGLYMKFDELMRPYILDLIEKSYTKMGWEPIFALSSPYAMRLLELMLQYQNIPGMDTVIKRNFTVEEIRFFLNVPEDAYQGRQDNFRRRILDVPMAEINRKTKYYMDYTVFKIGRKTSHFEITLDTRGVSQVKDEKLSESVQQKSESVVTQPIKKPTDKLIAKKIIQESEIDAFLRGEEETATQNDETYVNGEDMEEIYSLKDGSKSKLTDVENLVVMQNYDTELSERKKTLNAMRKDAESCGLKPEDFHFGEIPIKAEYASVLRQMYKINVALTKTLLIETYGMTLERFEELYKP